MNFSNFIPVNLIEARKSISQIHAGIKRVQHKDESVRLNELIEKISTLSMGNLKDYAFSLRLGDVNLLLSYFISEVECKNARKIFMIIKERYRRSFLKLFWKGFQKRYYDYTYNRYVYELISNEDDCNILNVEKDAYYTIKNWFRSHDIVKSIVRSFKDTGYDINSFRKRYNIAYDSELMIAIYRDVFINEDAEFFKTQTPLNIIAISEYFDKEHYCQFVNNYLYKLDLKDFDNKIINSIIKNIGKPDDLDKKFFWNRIDSVAKDKIIKWIINNELENFFDDEERFIYWRKYLSNIKKIYAVKSKQQLFMVFERFVAIEFGQKGNAAYFYSREYFDKYLVNYTNNLNSRSNSFFKDREKSLDYALHIGSWQYRFDYIIHRYGG